MEDDFKFKTDHIAGFKRSNPDFDQDSSESGVKRLKDEDFEKLKSTRTELLQKHFGYTDDQNPFGDQDLTEPFVWEKNEKFNSFEAENSDKLKVKVVQSKVYELKNLKERREKYELEKSRLIELRSGNDRGDDDESLREWEEKGIEFNLKQIVAKPLMRFKQGRMKLIDKLVLKVDPDFEGRIGESFDVENLFKCLTPQDLNEAIEILNAFIELDKIPRYSEYFSNLLLIAKEPERNFEMSGVSEMVSRKIDEILSTKSISELSVYEDQIRQKLSGKGVVDTNFWETALSRIPYFKACKYVTHTLNNNPGNTADVVDSVDEVERHDTVDKDDTVDIKKRASKGDVREREDFEKFVEYTKLDEGEEVFDEVVALEGENPDLELPRYYNRVKKGVEWTKYNLAHYTEEKLPPKQVQGYRFNVFYPKLRGKIPSWKLLRDGSRSETVLIRFSGGHPYRDLAFRIVNREWNTDHQRGFKNFFDNGVLHLCFDFKKIKYRR